VSSAELVLGAPLVLPGEILDTPEPPPATFVEELRAALPPPPTRPLAAQAGKTAPTDSLLKAEFVYVKRGGVFPPLSQPYVGPYKVIKKGLKAFVVAVGSEPEVISVDRLKPHLGLQPLQPAVPAQRGRPPKSPAASSVAAADGVSTGGEHV